jgi:hypothetical protein
MKSLKRYQEISFNMQKVRESKIVETSIEGESLRHTREIDFDQFYKFLISHKNEFEPLKTFIELHFMLKGVRYLFEVSNKAVESILVVCKDAVLNDFQQDYAKLYYLTNDFSAENTAKRFFYIEGDKILPLSIMDSHKEGEKITDFIVIEEPNSMWFSRERINNIYSILAYRKYYALNEATKIQKIIDLGIDDSSFLINSEDYYRDYLTSIQIKRLTSIEQFMLVVSVLLGLILLTGIALLFK